MLALLGRGQAPDLFLAIGLLAAVNVVVMGASMWRARRRRRAEFVDGLTGLLNRRALVKRLSTWPATTDAAAVIVDVDDFTDLNEAFGTAVGDAVLIELARRIDSLNQSGLSCRWGADEFVVVVPDVTGHEALVDIAESVARRLSEPVVVAGAPLALTVRAAVGAWPMHAPDWEELLLRVDAALKRARSGRPIVIYDPNQDQVRSLGLGLIGDLRKAVDDGELVVHYQPRVRLADEAITGAEALLRWDHPTRGLLQPTDFIPLAEAAGLVGALTRRVLQLAVADAAHWRDGGRDLRIAVNLSAHDLADVTLPAFIDQLLQANNLPADRLMLEVTETAFMLDVDTGAELLDALARRGITVAIDDFGTGYSSMARVAALPARELKIDKCFVDELDAPGSAAVVRATIELARDLGMRVVAEGVETHDQVERLIALGCDDAQGFWFGRPMTAEQFENHAAALASEFDGEPERAVYHAVAPSPVVTPKAPSLAPISPIRPHAAVDAVVDGGWQQRIRDLRDQAIGDVGRLPIAIAVAYLLVYGVWLFVHWPGGAQQELIGDLAFAPVNGFAVFACWRAARHATGNAQRGWKFLALAMTAYLVGDVAQLLNEVVIGWNTYPAPDDALYLSMYPLALIGLFSFPVARQRGRREFLQLALDVGTIVVAGAAAIGPGPRGAPRGDRHGARRPRDAELLGSLAARSALPGTRVGMGRAGHRRRLRERAGAAAGRAARARAATRPPARARRGEPVGWRRCG